jgi:hypothetical protein
MRTVGLFLEKAAAFDQLAAHAPNDVTRAAYREIAAGYRDLAANRKIHIQELAAAIAARKDGLSTE